MATEVKAEAKPQEAKAEAKTEAKAEVKEEAEEEASEPPLKYKTWVLKVSVHCEACKRKVKKILTNIEGVYTTDIDLRQQKVTVVGNVEAETLIKRLVKKTGKHAELWPEKADQKEKKKGKAKNKEKEKEKQRDQENNNNSEEDNDGGENEKETVVKAEVVKIQDPTPPTKATTENVHVISHKPPSEAGGGGAKTGTVQVKEVKIDVKPTTVTLPAGNQSPVAEKKVGGESEGGADKNGGGGGGGGSGGKKKKKKGHKGNNTNSNNNNNNHHGEEGEHSSGHAPAGSGSPTHHNIGQVQMVHPANQSPPRHHHGYHDYPVQHYYAPPVYAVSSNVAYPSTSYGGSYYAPPYSYAYMHPGNASVEPPPPDLESYSSQPSDSFEIFSDENPNACSVM
ncbi:hypothetical protein Tsubulata_028853 [Turnera subulata]|uniref:HMA domain-containing protein n=1 Tax=Turnera subulata TaxID=218843 RepID=A0A9Q0G318_9ROSI|nr:hypothetical protein Tsubulata_028853 [Turnera subulata]